MNQNNELMKDLSIIDLIDFLTSQSRDAQSELGKSSHLVRCSALMKIA